jgi:hypothetical protein
MSVVFVDPPKPGLMRNGFGKAQKWNKPAGSKDHDHECQINDRCYQNDVIDSR